MLNAYRECSFTPVCYTYTIDAQESWQQSEMGKPGVTARSLAARSLGMLGIRADKAHGPCQMPCHPMQQSLYDFWRIGRAL